MPVNQRHSRRAFSAHVDRAVLPGQRRKRFDFAHAVTEGLRQLGARQAGAYGWQLDTVGGLLDISPYDAWVACRFDDVERAKAHVRSGNLNPYSGKWNWHFVKPTPDDVEYLIEQLDRILLVPKFQ
jgi:hypothetical protein